MLLINDDEIIIRKLIPDKRWCIWKWTIYDF